MTLVGRSMAVLKEPSSVQSEKQLLQSDGIMIQTKKKNIIPETWTGTIGLLLDTSM